jgi:hypothetical protein
MPRRGFSASKVRSRFLATYGVDLSSVDPTEMTGTIEQLLHNLVELRAASARQRQSPEATIERRRELDEQIAEWYEKERLLVASLDYLRQRGATKSQAS